MDPGFLDRLSPDQWYILRAEVELRIRSHEASEIDTANRPHHLLHGAGAGDQPATEPEPYYSQPIIPGDICNIDVDSRLFHQLEDLEATVRTQQVQPVWGGLPPPQPPLSYYSNLGFSANQGIEPLGPAQLYRPEALALVQVQVQPQQTWASEAATGTSFPEFPENDSLSFENSPPSTLGSFGWGELSQPQLRGEAQDAVTNTYQSSPAEIDFTCQQGAATASMTSNFSHPGPMLHLNALLHSRPHAVDGYLFNRRPPELDEFEPAPNGTRPMVSGASQPTALKHYPQSSQIDEPSEGARPMVSGSAGPAAKMIEMQKTQDSQSRGTTQAERKAHDEIAYRSNLKNVAKRRKKANKFPTNIQNENANLVRMNGGACARCAKQKNKCMADPKNLDGPCLTCLQLSTTLDRQLPCFRGKITEAVLFRKYVDPDYGRPDFSVTFDIGLGIFKPVTGWDSEAKVVELTRGLGPTICLRVVKAKTLDQTDIPESQRPIYECPWALANFPGAVNDFRKFLWSSISVEITNRIKKNENPLTFAILGQAWQLATREEGPSLLLQRVLMVWSGSRHIEGGWHFHGPETLDLQTHHGSKVPLTAAPSLDSEVSSIIVRHHLEEAQKLALEEIQRLLDRNNAVRRKRMFELFLAYFILLDNCERNMKHQRNWALHNNSPFWYTPRMVGFVEGILRTVKLILHFWRSDLKGQFPFSPDWDPNRGPKVVDITPNQLSFFKGLGKRLNGKETTKSFNQLFQNWENYDRDYCFTGQLFVPDGEPFSLEWLSMPAMPKSAPAPKYGPARPGTND